MSWKYKEVYNLDLKNHRKNGCVLEHRYIAQQILNRPLKDTEVVHHKDGDKTNNDKNNLMVFKTQGDHSRFHSGQYRELILGEDGAYECISKTYKKRCKQCNKEFETLSPIRQYCSHYCASYSQRKVERPSKEELKDFLLANSYKEAGRKFGVADNNIRKWCKQYNIFEEINSIKEQIKKDNKKARMPKDIEQSKPILQYTKQGDFVKEYSSAMEAARALGNINYGPNIIRCANGKRKTANKYIWVWKK